MWESGCMASWVWLWLELPMLVPSRSTTTLWVVVGGFIVAWKLICLLLNLVFSFIECYFIEFKLRINLNFFKPSFDFFWPSFHSYRWIILFYFSISNPCLHENAHKTMMNLVAYCLHNRLSSRSHCRQTSRETYHVCSTLTSKPLLLFTILLIAPTHSTLRPFTTKVKRSASLIWAPLSC